MLNSVARFPQLRRRSDMTACEWETGFRRERLASMHFYLGKHECIQAGRNYCLAMILLWSCGSVQQVWGCPLFVQCRFAFDCPLILHQPGKKYVPSKCEQQEPNQLSFHAEWMASFWGRGHSFDLHYFKKNRLANKHHQHGVDDGLELKHSLTMWLKFVFFFALDSLHLFLEYGPPSFLFKYTSPEGPAPKVDPSEAQAIFLLLTYIINS